MWSDSDTILTVFGSIKLEYVQNCENDIFFIGDLINTFIGTNF